MRYISSISSCISNLRENLHIESKSKRYSNTPAHTASQAYAKESNCDPLYHDVCIPSPSQWIGNNYLCFRCGTTFSNSPFGYKQHEEQYAFGIYADDIITSNKFDKYFDSLLKNIR